MIKGKIHIDKHGLKNYNQDEAFSFLNTDLDNVFSVYHDYEDDGYWSASSYDYGSSNGIFFNNDRSCFNCWCWKYRGESVRLVCDLVE